MCMQFGWTEKMLYEENTTGFIRRVGEFNSIRRKAEKIIEQRQKGMK